MRTYKNILITTVILSILINFRLSGQTYSSTTISTPNGTSVDAYILTSGEMSSYWKDYYRNFWEDYYDYRISFQSEATYTYNCHAYAWWKSKGGSAVWLNNPGDDTFWNDESYIEVTSQSEATNVSFGGPCWYYSQEFQEYANWCDHSAITTGTTNAFISKWGSSPLFRHNVNDCPYDDQDLHFYVHPYITGPALVCSSGAEFTVTNLPSGATINWSQTQGLTRVSAQGSNPCEFESSENGIHGWISATITYNGNDYILHNKVAWLGTPNTPTSISKYAESEALCIDSDISFICDDESSNPWDLTYYNWIVYASADILSGQGTTFIYVRPSGGGNLTFSVEAQNECGSSDKIYSDEYYIEDCSFKFALYPNPATDYLRIELSEVPAEKTLLEVYDSQGTKRISSTMADKEKTIDISKLQKGVYYITVVGKIKGKEKVSTERFIKE